MHPDFHILITLKGQTIIANPHGNAGQKPAKTLDMALATTQQTQDMLEGCGFSDLELIEMTPQIATMQNEILNAEADHQEKRIKDDEAYFITMLNASMVRAVMAHKGVVDEVAILQAPESKLAEFADWYESEARANLDEQNKFLSSFKSTQDVQAPISSPKYALLYMRFDRIATLYWMCLRRLGKV